jgi:hypothetical protein
MQIPFVITALFAAGVPYIFYLIISSFLISSRNAAKARQLKCEEPLVEKNRWPLGIDNLMRTLRADRSQQFPADLIQRFNEVGATTHKYQTLGRHSQQHMI